MNTFQDRNVAQIFQFLAVYHLRRYSPRLRRTNAVYRYAYTDH